jgi:hypothetical protein
MIVVKISGGLGNQMFQYAAARALANHHNVDLMLDLSWFKNIPEKNTTRLFELHNYPINAHIASVDEEAHLKIYHSWFLTGIRTMNKEWKYMREKSFSFDNNFYSYPSNAYLDGYWQSNLYFEKIDEQIRSQFQPIEAPSDQDKILLKEIKKNNSVAIHVRRGDYVENTSANRFHGLCTLEYYGRAIDIILKKEKNLNFYIFSDDLPWAQDNFSIPGSVVYVGHNTVDQAFNDLRLMAACSHQIIANSSFSWWGAWLNTNPSKTVIAPSKWFVNKRDTKTLIPNSWITV